MNKTVFLKIKLKSLAAESKIIRQQELKTFAHTPEFTQLRDELAHHRRKDVRCESRATGLAYGYLRGTPYRSIEPTCKSDVMSVQRRGWCIDRASQMVKKYGTAEQVAGFQKWTEEPPVQLPAIAAQEVAVL